MDRKQLYRPAWKQEWRILRTQDTKYETYYAFPALLRRGNEILITVKSGTRHVSREPASLTQVTMDAQAQRVTDMQVVYDEDAIAQMGEIVQMPNGDVCIYIDLQDHNNDHCRVGMWELRSTDGGRTYPISRRVGIIDGVEYGYPLDMVTVDGQVYMLAMAFDYQAGARFREVHLITSADSGESWHFCANLTETFGFPFNECALALCGEGFLVFTRGEHDRRVPGGTDFSAGQHLVVLDRDFRVLRMRDYRRTTDFFTLTGRPRLYWLEGDLCLFTRQWNEDEQNRMMSLDMFRMDPQSLDILSRVRLDAPRFPGQDGHYPVAYAQDGLLHVVTYITCDKDARETFEAKCDLVQLSFRLDEVLAFGKEQP